MPLRFPLKPCLRPFLTFLSQRARVVSMPSAVSSTRAYSPLRRFSPYTHDAPMFDATDSIFGELDDVFSDQSMVPFPWDPDPDTELKSTFSYMHPSLPDNFLDSSGLYTPEDSSPFFNNDLSLAWPSEPEPHTSPIPIPSPTAESQFVPYHGPSHFPDDSSFSPVSFAALHPLPASVSPSSSFDDSCFDTSRQRVDSISSIDTSSLVVTPDWASQLWDSSQQQPASALSPRSISRPSPLSARRGSIGHIFQSSSAPSFSPLSGPGPIRSYSHLNRAESTSEDRDATVRRKRKTSVPDEVQRPDKATDSRKSSAA